MAINDKVIGSGSDIIKFSTSKDLLSEHILAEMEAFKERTKNIPLCICGHRRSLHYETDGTPLKGHCYAEKWNDKSVWICECEEFIERI